MGTDPPYGAGPGQLPTQGCATDHREAANEAGVGGVGVSSAGNSDGGGGFWRDRGIHQK